MAIPQMAKLALEMLHTALDAFVNQDTGAARALIPQDKQVDALNKEIHRQLANQMIEDPRDHRAMPKSDGGVQEPGTHRRPRKERG